MNKNKKKLAIPADVNVATKKMLEGIPVEESEKYAVRWTTRVVPHCWDYEDFDSIQEAEPKFMEVAQNYFYVDLIKITSSQKVIKKIYGSHV